MNIKSKLISLKWWIKTPYKKQIRLFKKRMRYFNLIAKNIDSIYVFRYATECSNCDVSLEDDGFTIEDKKKKSILRKEGFQYTIER